MDTGGNGDLGCENRSSGLLDCSSLGNFTSLPADEVLGTTTGSEHWNRRNSSFNGGWTPLDSVTHNIRVGTSPMSCFGSGTFSDIDNFCIPQSCRWIANSGCSSDYPSERNGDKNEKALTPQCIADDYAISPEGEGTVKSSPDGNKRRRASDNLSQFAQLKDMKAEKDQSTGMGDEEKQKPEIKQPVTKKCKQVIGKEVNDSSSSGDAPKEDYVHVRAKRGQATNSHSLAERVRREKIRERMKFLQDLVPGCDKITGKAVMLDEIINYVLSLQKQVQFLSMKVATVYPERNVEPDQILQRDIHYSQGGSATILCDPGMSPYPSVVGIWANELQNTRRVGFSPDLASNNPEANGSLM